MAPRDEVGRRTEAHSLTPTERSKHIPPCIMGGTHFTQASYGKSTLEHLGIIYGRCTKECREFNMKPLGRQPDAWQRFKLFLSLLEITQIPASYDENTFRNFCATEAEKSLSEVLRHSDQRAALASALVPSSHGAIASPAVPSRSNAHADRETLIVSVYFYVKDHGTPISIDAEGIKVDGLVEYRRAQPAITDELRRVLGPRKKPRWQLWCTSRHEWVEAPKADEVEYLLPGQGRLYKLKAVKHLTSLKLYQSLASPSVDREAPVRPRATMSRASMDRFFGPSSPSSSSSISTTTTLPRGLAPFSSAPMDAEFVQGSSGGRAGCKRRVYTPDSSDTPTKKARVSGVGCALSNSVKGKDKEVIIVSDDDL